MQLAAKLAGIHVIVIILAAIATWPVPLDGIAWLRAIDFVVVWHFSSFGGIAVQIVRRFGQGGDLHQVALVACALYLASLLLAGMAQWFAIGPVFSKLNRMRSTKDALVRHPTERKG